MIEPSLHITITMDSDALKYLSYSCAFILAAIGLTIAYLLRKEK